MKNFDTRVQQMKFKVLKELAIQTWKRKDAFTVFNEISNEIVVKGEPPISCCIYKDRAIIADRMRVGLGDIIGEKSTVQVVTIACDECPRSGHVVTDLCRGCMAHSCDENCPIHAIAIDERGYAHIDKKSCTECGACLRACKYNAIINQRRPCEQACGVDAITMDEDGSARIIADRCIVCGKCVFECPFGAVLDRSQIVDVITMLRDKKDETVYAIIAPSVAAQFHGVTTAQVLSGILELGFDVISEVAAGADATALQEADEITEKEFLTSSCCPSFVEYINRFFPELKGYISETLSPMAMTAKIIKEKDATAKVVFIGPCIAKKWEQSDGKSGEYIDAVLTFEELIALFASKDIKCEEMKETILDEASSFGRGFPVTGGVSLAVSEAIKEKGYTFELKPAICSGISECRKALTLAKYGKLDGNFIEGMICEGGCINGNGGLKNKAGAEKHIRNYCNAAGKKTVI